MTVNRQAPGEIFEPDSLIAQAIEFTGLNDFGELAFREPMERLLWSLEHEADLNGVGRTVIRQRVVNTLANNLRMQHFLKKYPEIRDEKIVEPVAVVGLPRTGTTMLHRTIAADNRMFAALWFEVRNPAPYLDWDFTREGDRRVAEAKAEVDAMLEASPELASIHPMDALGPDEDIMLLEHSFYSTMPESYANVPSFGRWLEQQDQTVAYEYLKLQLQFLQWQKKRAGQHGQRWVLKAPHHLHFMDLLFKVFPDVRVVQTHRDSVQTIPSLASLIYATWIIYSDSADSREVGRQWSHIFARGMKHTMRVRKQLPADRFLDLWFRDTVSDPLGEIEKVYRFIGMDLTDEAKTAMEAWQEHNRRELRPPHEYSLGDFGFTEEGLGEQFAEYRESFIKGH